MRVEYRQERTNERKTTKRCQILRGGRDEARGRGREWEWSPMHVRQAKRESESEVVGSSSR